MPAYNAGAKCAMYHCLVSTLNTIVSKYFARTYKYFDSIRVKADSHRTTRLNVTVELRRDDIGRCEMAIRRTRLGLPAIMATTHRVLRLRRNGLASDRYLCIDMYISV